MDFIGGYETEIVNFVYNYATRGSTIYAQASSVIIETMMFAYNIGQEGGCIHFVSTDV